MLNNPSSGDAKNLMQTDIKVNVGIVRSATSASQRRLWCRVFESRLLYLSTAPPAKTVVKERRPSSGGVKSSQQVFYTEWKNDTGFLKLLFFSRLTKFSLPEQNNLIGYFVDIFVIYFCLISWSFLDIFNKRVQYKMLLF